MTEIQNMYRRFKNARTVLCTIFLLFISMPVFAQDPLFTIEGVKVDVTAENAIKAREEAFNQAQIKAFEELQKRMLPEGEIATQALPDPLTISAFIQDFEITNEQLSAVRYVGTYTFRFQDRAVRRHFNRSSTPHTAVSRRKSLVVLPFLQVGTASTLWSPYNGWMRAWNRAGKLGGVVSLQLPLGDLDDVSDIKDDEALSYSPARLNKLLKRYSADEAVIAIAMPDEYLAKIREDSATARGRLSVEIYRTDRTSPEMVKQVNVIADGAQTRAQLYDLAVNLVHQALQKDWKAKTIVKTQDSNRFGVVIPIQSLQQWVKIESDLNKVSGIDGTLTRSLTPQEAQVDLLYQGDVQQLVHALGQFGMTLERGVNARGEGVNILNPGLRSRSGGSGYGAKGFKAQF